MRAEHRVASCCSILQTPHLGRSEAIRTGMRSCTYRCMITKEFRVLALPVMQMLQSGPSACGGDRKPLHRSVLVAHAHDLSRVLYRIDQMRHAAAQTVPAASRLPCPCSGHAFLRLCWLRRSFRSQSFLLPPQSARLVRAVLSCRCDHDRPGGRHRRFRMVRIATWLRPPRVMRIATFRKFLCVCVVAHLLWNPTPGAAE